MPNIKKTIKDIVSAPFDKYDKFYSDLKKKEAAQHKLRSARQNDIRIAQEHERRKREGMDQRKKIIQEPSSPSRSQFLKTRGTQSSAIRKLIK